MNKYLLDCLYVQMSVHLYEQAESTFLHQFWKILQAKD